MYPVDFCFAILYANCSWGIHSSHRCCLFFTYCETIVLIVRLVLSTGLHCGVYAGVSRCFIPQDFSSSVNWADRN